MLPFTDSKEVKEKIILGEEQQQALECIIEFINSKKVVFSLIGYAGTGKSTMIKQMIDYIESKKISYVLCAPTHKAKSVIMYATERDAITIHQLLKLSPNIEILDLDLRDIKFISSFKKPLEIPYGGIVICDESSMVNDVLFHLMVEKCSSLHCKIIFVGDIAQLKPVNESNHSLVFQTPDHFELKKIYRQVGESGVSSILPILRDSVVSKFEESLGKDGSLYCVDNALDLFRAALPSFQKAITDENIFETKLLAYTNKRVSAFNNKMRSVLFPGDQEFNKTETLTAYENFAFGWSNYWNSMDYIINKEPSAAKVHIPHFTVMEGSRISLYDTGTKGSDEILVLSKQTPDYQLSALATLIEETRLDAIEKKASGDRRSGLAWKKYYEILNSFACMDHLFYDGRVVKKKTFDYGYACTVHKSQGSSLNNVFIDMKDISVCRDPQELRQLQYVSVSRAKTNVFILQ